MEDNVAPAGGQKKRKILLETRDLLMGAAFPFIVMIVLSSTIILFSNADDLAVSIIVAVIGEGFFIAAYLMFGRQNGATAYRKYILNSKKRSIGSTDETAVLKIGEYAIWKGIVIAFIGCIPFMIFLTVNLCAQNDFCEFMLLYACGWAYFPVRYGMHPALCYLLVLLPTGVHLLGYALGKIKETKLQEKIAEESAKSGRKRRK